MGGSAGLPREYREIPCCHYDRVCIIAKRSYSHLPAGGDVSSADPEFCAFGGFVRVCDNCACSFLSEAAKPQNPQIKLPLLQTADQTNDRIMELAVADAAKQGDYIIGSGDLLGIEVFDVPELSRDVRVNETGYLSIPLLPIKVQATGLTPFQLQDKLAELLQVNGLVTNPEVTVVVKERHSEPITVIGAVRNPVVVQAVHQTTLLEVLSQAGGIADNAGSEVVITRVTHAPDQDDQPVNDPQEQPVLIKIGMNDLLRNWRSEVQHSGTWR